MEEVGMEGLYERWFDDLLPRGMLLPSKTLAAFTAHIIHDELQLPFGGPQLDILVTHDMNIFPICHYLLGQTIEDHVPVEHMGAIPFFERDGEVFLQSYHCDAQLVTLEGCCVDSLRTVRFNGRLLKEVSDVTFQVAR